MKKNLKNLKEIFLPTCLAFLFFSSCSTENEAINDTEINAVYAKTSSKSDYVVLLKNESIPDGFETEMESLGATVKSMIPEIGVAIISSTETISSKIATKAKIRSVVPDFNVQWIDPELYPEASPLSIGSDEPFFDYLWGMDAIDAPEAWNTGQTGSGDPRYICFVPAAFVGNGCTAAKPPAAEPG